MPNDLDACSESQPILDPILTDRLQVLVVQSDPDEARRVRQIVSRFEAVAAEITAVDSVEQADDLLARRAFNVCLLDFWIATQTCVRLTQRIYRQRAGSVIVVSDFDESCFRDLSRTVGAVDYLAKGTLSATLEGAISRAV